MALIIEPKDTRKQFLFTGCECGGEWGRDRTTFLTDLFLTDLGQVSYAIIPSCFVFSTRPMRPAAPALRPVASCLCNGVLPLSRLPPVWLRHFLLSTRHYSPSASTPRIRSPIVFWIISIIYIPSAIASAYLHIISLLPPPSTLSLEVAARPTVPCRVCYPFSSSVGLYIVEYLFTCAILRVT